MKKTQKADPYPDKYVGSYGTFFSGDSFPVEYVQTTLTIHEMQDKLRYAREIRPKNLDFDLLMQRDIDEERVKDKIAPYLNMASLNPVEIKSKTIFFPPLLVAIVPTKSKQMLKHYSDETGDAASADFAEREWENHFKLTFFKGEGPETIPIKVAPHGKNEEIQVDRTPVTLSVRSPMGAQEGATLVVIDGQHRLAALKEVYQTQRELIEDLLIPVCILFSSQSTSAVANQFAKAGVPDVSEVFRHLFVDVNTTTERVGGHFNILLSDQTIGNLICRRFCDQTLKNRGAAALSAIEWNTKKAKDSTIRKRSYSITSIGVLDKGLALFARVRAWGPCLKYLINEPEVPQLSENEEDGPVNWERFSFTQKRIIEAQIDKHVVPCIDALFFQTKAFQELFELYETELQKLKVLAESDDDGHVHAEQAYLHIVEYVPISSSAAASEARASHAKFVKDFETLREEKIAAIIGYSIFHRSIIDAWASMLDIVRKSAVLPTTATQSFVHSILNRSLESSGALFRYDKSYMQHSVFSAQRIKPKEATKKALADLVIAQFGNKDSCSEFVSALELDPSSHQELFDKLFAFGQAAAGDFLAHYVEERKKAFVNTYPVDFTSLDQEAREELQAAEELKKQHKKEAQEGKRTKEEVSTKFEDLVSKYVKADVETARQHLKAALKYEGDILAEETDTAEEDDDT